MKRRILASFVGVIVTGVALTTALMALLAYQLFEGRVMDGLRQHAEVFSAMIARQGAQALDDAPRGELRLTLIGADGAVLLDNSADPDGMDNHLDRTEVLAAREDGSGCAVRESQTMDRSMFYYALRLPDGGVLRVAEEASSLTGVFLRTLPLFALVLLVMVLLCVATARRLTAGLIRPIEQMTAHLDDVRGVPRYPELEPFVEMIEQQHDEILRSADMRVEFTANVSHELKTPLTSISGYAELIESGMATGEQATRFAGEIRQSANRLLTLINDIIRLSQLDGPMHETNVEPVDLSQVAENTVRQLGLNAHRMGVTLELDAKPAVISADRQMMEELLYNLCDNAIRYNVSGGSVRVEVRPLRDKVMVCVQDTGIGISEENQKHVFERFYRVDKSRSKATGGTGLGLAIVKHIAARHDAEIEIDSELGRGTAITVTFPRGARA